MEPNETPDQKQDKWQQFGIYVDILPIIRDTVRALSTDEQWAVYIAILDRDMTFTELKEEFKATPIELTAVLKPLVNEGLIEMVDMENQTPDNPPDITNTYYTSSEYGRRFIRALFDIIIPKPSEKYKICAARKQDVENTTSHPSQH